MTRKLLAALCGFTALGLLLLLIFNPLDGNPHGDLLHFFGRFHPLILHLPIGLLLLLGLLEALGAFESFAHLRPSIPLVLTLAIASLLAALGTGFFLAYARGSNEPLVLTHMETAIYLGVGVLALGILKLFEGRRGMVHLYRVLLVVSLGLLMAASHYGGSITHGEDYLTRYMPDPIRPLFGVEGKEVRAIADPDQFVVYTDLVRPIFEQNCVSCHNPNKLEGELSLDTYEDLRVGGESGAVISPGQRQESELYRRITLSSEHEDFMPAEGKPPLSEGEIALLGWWIDQGAPKQEKVAAFSEIPGEVEGYLTEAFESRVSEEERTRLAQERRKLYDELQRTQESLGVLILPTRPEAREFKLETFAAQKNFDDEALEELEPYAPYFVSADLSGTQLTDEAVEILARFENLRHLNLSRTQITGKNLGRLAQLNQLKSLNLYGTPIELEHLEELTRLTQLDRLFLFQTEFSVDSALARIRTALPDCQIVLE